MGNACVSQRRELIRGLPRRSGLISHQRTQSLGGAPVEQMYRVSRVPREMFDVRQSGHGRINYASATSARR